MKAKLRLIIVMCTLLLFSLPVQAAENITTDTYANRAGTKIFSGITNVATGWIELPKNIKLWNQKESNPLVGWAEGILRGLVHTVSRTGSGALDLVTFWLPTYATPHPTFVWDNFDQESKYHAFRSSR